MSYGYGNGYGGNCNQCRCNPCKCHRHYHGGPHSPPFVQIVHPCPEECPPDDDQEPATPAPQDNCNEGHLLKVTLDEFIIPEVGQNSVFTSECAQNWAKPGMYIKFPGLGWVQVTAVSGNSITYENINIPVNTTIPSGTAFCEVVIDSNIINRELAAILCGGSDCDEEQPDIACLLGCTPKDCDNGTPGTIASIKGPDGTVPVICNGQVVFKQIGRGFVPIGADGKGVQIASFDPVTADVTGNLNLATLSGEAIPDCATHALIQAFAYVEDLTSFGTVSIQVLLNGIQVASASAFEAVGSVGAAFGEDQNTTPQIVSNGLVPYEFTTLNATGGNVRVVFYLYGYYTNACC